MSLEDVPTSLVLALHAALAAVLVYRYATRCVRPVSGDVSSRDLIQPPIPMFRLPILGHALYTLFFTTSYIAWCRKRYGPVFKLSVPIGRKIIFVSSPHSIRFLQTRSPKEIASVNYQSLRPLSGLPAARIPFIFTCLHRNAFPAATSSLTRGRLSKSISPAISHLASALRSISSSKGASFSSIDVVTLVCQPIYISSVKMFYGENFPTDTYRDCMEFDREFFFVATEFPILKNRGTGARERLISAIRSFLQHHWLESEDGGSLDGGASHPMSRAIREMIVAGFSKEEVARSLFLILWGAHGNMLNMAVWVMIYLTSNPYAYLRIQDAVRATYPGTEPNFDALTRNFVEIPILTSAIKEAMRLTVQPMSYREALTDIVVPQEGGRSFVILKGEQFVLETTGIHYDPIYHANPHVFKVDRFVGPNHTTHFGECDGVKTLVPFGGGLYMCKGREYTQRIMQSFFILFMQMYDVAHWGYKVPAFESRVAGVLHPKTIPSIKIRFRGGCLDANKEGG